MCGRVTVHKDERHMAKFYQASLEHFRQQAGWGDDVTGRDWVVLPGSDVPSVMLDKRGVRSLILAPWGFVQGDRLVYNARSERLADPYDTYWPEHVNRRCIVPVTSFYERAHRVAIPGHTIGLGAFHCNDEHHSIVVVTRPSSASLASFHTRQPVVVPHDRVEAWLDPHSTWADFSDLCKAQEPFEEVSAARYREELAGAC